MLDSFGYAKYKKTCGIMADGDMAVPAVHGGSKSKKKDRGEAAILLFTESDAPGHHSE